MLVIILNSYEAVVFDSFDYFKESRTAKGRLANLTVYNKDGMVIGDFKGSAIKGYYLTRFNKNGREVAMFPFPKSGK